MNIPSITPATPRAYAACSHILLLLLTLLLTPLTAAAQYAYPTLAVPDTIAVSAYGLHTTVGSMDPTRDKHLHTIFDHDAMRIGFAPTLFFAASALTWNEREHIRRIRNRYVPGFRNTFDNYLQHAPAVATYGLKISGVKGRNKLPRTLLSHATSLVIMGALVNSIKYTARVERPDVSRRNSFPSGHTAVAFTNATFMHKEYGDVNPIYSVAGYSSATFVALGRSLNNRHWLPDILAGAGIGILSTQLGYFFIDKIYKNKGDNLSLFSRFESSGTPSFLAIKLGSARSAHNLLIYPGADVDAYTHPGLEAGFEGAWFPGHHWGVGGECAFVTFPVDPSAPMWVDAAHPERGHMRLQAQSVGTVNMSLGPYYAITPAERWVMMAKVNAGLAFAAKGTVTPEPERDASGLDRELSLYTYEPRTAWIAGTGASVTYLFREGLGVTLYGDYHYSRPVVHLTFADPEHPDERIRTASDLRTFDYLSVGLRLTAFF